MARFVESPLSESTITFEYIDNGTVTALSLDATSFTGGGGGGGDSNHSHGNILSTGTITSAINIASGMRFLIASNNSVIYKTNLAFGASSDYFLANNGTWQSVQGGGGSTVIDAHTRLFEMPYSTGGALSIYDITGSVSSSVTYGTVASYINAGDVVKIKVPFDMTVNGWYTFNRAYDAMGVYYFEGRRTWKDATNFREEIVTFNAASATYTIPNGSPVSRMVPVNMTFDVVFTGNNTVNGYQMYLQNGANIASIINAHRLGGNNVTLRCSNCASLFNVQDSTVITWPVNCTFSTTSSSYGFNAAQVLRPGGAATYYYKTDLWCASTVSTISDVYLRLTSF